MKKKYMKPEQRIIVLQHQSHLLQASSGKEVVHSLRGGYLDYGGDDEDYDGPVR